MTTQRESVGRKIEAARRLLRMAIDECASIAIPGEYSGEYTRDPDSVPGWWEEDLVVLLCEAEHMLCSAKIRSALHLLEAGEDEWKALRE